MLTKWLGVLEVALLLGGLTGLLVGTYLLATSLLPGLIVILAIVVLLFLFGGEGGRGAGEIGTKKNGTNSKRKARVSLAAATTIAVGGPSESDAQNKCRTLQGRKK
jgi:hypothetical protein